MQSYCKIFYETAWILRTIDIRSKKWGWLEAGSAL